MFTGIIEEVGSVRELRSGTAGARISIGCLLIPADLKIGDSVAVNGVCLTVVHVGSDVFSCDLSLETLSRSSLSRVRPSSAVNLERALPVGGRLGGHFVLGHVDGMGTLASSAPSGDGWLMEFSFPGELERYLVHKGSVAVDGISLTLAWLGEKSFKVAVIPHTFKATNLRHLKPGSPVNLEVDILGRYFERFIRLGLAGQLREEKDWIALLGED